MQCPHQTQVTPIHSPHKLSFQLVASVTTLPSLDGPLFIPLYSSLFCALLLRRPLGVLQGMLLWPKEGEWNAPLPPQ